RGGWSPGAVEGSGGSGRVRLVLEGEIERRAVVGGQQRGWHRSAPGGGRGRIEDHQWHRRRRRAKVAADARLDPVHARRRGRDRGGAGAVRGDRRRALRDHGPVRVLDRKRHLGGGDVAGRIVTLLGHAGGQVEGTAGRHDGVTGVGRGRRLRRDGQAAAKGRARRAVAV